MTAIKKLHDAEHVHKDIHNKNVVFGFLDDPPDDQPKLKDVTYKSHFYLIGQFHSKNALVYLKKSHFADFGGVQRYMENGTLFSQSIELPRGRRSDMLRFGVILLNVLVAKLPTIYLTPIPVTNKIVVRKSS